MSAAPISSFFLWRPACWLRVEGPDAFDFLQGQFSNDLRALLRSGSGASGEGVAGESEDGRAEGHTAEAASATAAFAAAGLLSEAVYGLWLNRKGRILGDGFVLRAGEERFLVCSYETSGEVLRAHLEGFIVADEVELFDESPHVAGLRLLDGAAGLLPDRLVEKLLGSGAESGGGAVSDLSGEPSLLARIGGTFFTAPAGMCGGSADGGRVIEWVGPLAARETLLAQLGGVEELSFEEMERRRILAKCPAVPRDLGEGDLPQEGGPEFERAAVSYTKGCYLGQEVMARVHSMGRVRRQLVQIRSHDLLPPTSPVPVLPAPLYLGEKKVGELRSATRHGSDLIALALISVAHLPQATEPLAFSLIPNSENKSG